MTKAVPRLARLSEVRSDLLCPWSLPLGRVFREVTLADPIRYAPGDSVESWLNGLLCLDASVVKPISSVVPHPSACDLYVSLLVVFPGESFFTGARHGWPRRGASSGP